MNCSSFSEMSPADWPKKPLPPVIDSQTCAELLHCSKATVDELAEQGELPATKFGRGWVCHTALLLEYIRERCTREAEERKAARQLTKAQAAPANRLLVVSPRTAGRPRKAIPKL
jgi:excisionase family DNA binding protein